MNRTPRRLAVLGLGILAGVVMGPGPAATLRAMPDSHPAPATSGPQVPPFAGYRLFEEYELVRADMEAMLPADRVASFWVNLRHLPESRRHPWVDLWAAAPGWREVKPGAGVYRVECPEPIHGAFMEAMANYPYSVAPSATTRPEWAVAHDDVCLLAKFPVPVVVRGDWLAAACQTRRELAAAFGVYAIRHEVDRWHAEELSAEWVFGECSAEGVCPAGRTVTRRALEAPSDAKIKMSHYVHWAKRAGLAIPRH